MLVWIIAFVVALLLAVPVARVAYSLVRWRTGVWLPRHLMQLVHHPRGAVDYRHLLVCIIDHFEPRAGETAGPRVREWGRRYRRIADRLRDADGRTLRHTWFLPFDQADWGTLAEAGALACAGYGEIEFHLHHDNLDEEAYRRTVRAGLEFFQRAGAMLYPGAPPRTAFAYVAGNWALDDAIPGRRGPRRELDLLRELGCYADFTFPAFGAASQPAQVNEIYYAVDDDGPKSYNRGVTLLAGAEPPRDALLLITGPMFFRSFVRGAVEYAALESFAPPARTRVGPLLRRALRIPGCRQWAFLKLHTHSMQSLDVFLSPALEEMMGEIIDQGARRGVQVHFVTARELFNVIKAAEAGHSGDPASFFSFALPPPLCSRLCTTAPLLIHEFDAGRLDLEPAQPGGPLTLRFASGPIERIEGSIARLRLLTPEGGQPSLGLTASGRVGAQLRAPIRCEGVGVVGPGAWVG